MHRQPFANCLASDGRFVLDLSPGRYTLQLIDLETGLAFHTEETDRELGAETAAVPLVIRPKVRWLELAFESTVPGGEVVFQGVSIDAERPRGGDLPALLGSGGSGSNKRQRGFWPWRAGTTSARWLVGGKLNLSATRTFQVLSPISNGWQGTDVDRAEVDPAGPEQRVTLRIPPPPDDATILAGPGK